MIQVAETLEVAQRVHPRAGAAVAGARPAAGAGGRRPAGRWPSPGPCARWRGCATRCRRAATARPDAGRRHRAFPPTCGRWCEAINHHVERNREQTEARRRFIDDASHQLRTPLATLATQVATRCASPIRRACARRWRRSRRSSTKPCARPTRCCRWRAPTAADLGPRAGRPGGAGRRGHAPVVVGGARARHRPRAWTRPRPARHAWRCRPAARGPVQPAAQRDPLHGARAAMHRGRAQPSRRRRAIAVVDNGPGIPPTSWRAQASASSAAAMCRCRAPAWAWPSSHRSPSATAGQMRVSAQPGGRGL